jgi:hypothetical protein
MISDRDIATHRVVMGRGPDMPVRDVMTADVKYCFEDQEIDEVPSGRAIGVQLALPLRGF